MDEYPGRKVEAGGGVIFRNNGTTDILLINRHDIWDLPKGHREPDESIAHCASREVSEELGIPTPDNLGFIGKTTHQYDLKGVTIHKQTSWFAMRTSASRYKPQKEEGITEIRWFTLEEAKRKVGYDNLKKLLTEFESWLAKNSK